MPLMVREFLLILLAAVVSSLLGLAVGAGIGRLAPELIHHLTRPDKIAAPVNVGAAMGLISGLLIGAATMIAGRFITALFSIGAALQQRRATSSPQFPSP